ncbi:MAG: hypothetical protein U5K69_29285 [Balneolaceae bacterium]|nr:hypothetical protein [Balneolaceae bacterium]
MNTQNTYIHITIRTVLLPGDYVVYSAMLPWASGSYRLDSLAWSSVAELEPIVKGKPHLFLGSSEAETAHPVTDMMREEFDEFPPMMTHVQKPSKEWRAQIAQHMAEGQADYAVLIWLGFNEYPKANKGIFKKKVVLGTGYEPEIRFLSAEDKPVEVL